MTHSVFLASLSWGLARTGWFLDEFVIQGLLLGVFKFDFVGVFLVLQFDRASLEVKHVVIF